MLDLTPKLTNEPRSISSCAYVVPFDVTAALIKKESLFAIGPGEHWRYLVNPWVGRGARPPLTAPSFISGVLVDRIVILVDTLPKRAIC